MKGNSGGQIAKLGVSRGRELARAVIARLMPRAVLVESKLARKATLAIVAGADPAGRRFVQIKERLLADVALNIQPVWLADNAVTADALRAVTTLNAREGVDAIFLQFPLPPQIDGQAVADALAPHKDVDCSGRAAEAAFIEGRTPFNPVAPQAVCTLLQDTLGSVSGRKILLCGDEDAFRGATRTLLERRAAVVQVAAPDSPDLRADLRQADALVICAALPHADVFAEVEWLPVVLDAGYYLPARPAGWLATSASERVGIVLNQYGNVGPLTVANLARATVRAAARRFPRIERTGQAPG
jgi:methylenetetrahydrofolate dehydrogenase (NADP+)/methenyltetrahydrofolate cyclohydrolase